ncbi:MAG TPA: hypothetical protein VEB21_01035 [Terriglobales bacterium]|nr:hypothetical protein [Terriglobales bacterium]
MVGQAEVAQFAPVQAGLQIQVPLKQRPFPLQLLGQLGAVEQLGPLQPPIQTHMFKTHTPFGGLQSLTQAASTRTGISAAKPNSVASRIHRPISISPRPQRAAASAIHNSRAPAQSSRKSQE